MKKNKKAIIFSISLVLITLSALISLLFIVSNIEKQIDPLRTIGERTTELMITNAEVQKILFFTQEAAKISTEKSVQQFLQNALLTNIQDCGIINFENQQYIYWNSPQNPDKKCFETDLYQNYAVYFNKQIKYYLDLLSTIPGKKIPQNNYDLFIKDGKELSAIASKPIKFSLFAPTETMQINDKIFWHYEEITTPKIAEYAIKQSFTIPFKYDFSQLKQVKQFARDTINCKDQDNQDTKDACINGIVSNYNNIGITTKKITDNDYAFTITGKITFTFMLYIPTPTKTQQK